MEFALGYFGSIPIEQPELMQAYAVIDAHSKSKGIKMGKNDVWVAASVLINDARLVSADEDFDHLISDFIELK